MNMKKFFLGLFVIFGLNGCSVDDGLNNDNINFDVAEITGNNLPDELIFGQQFQLSLTYNLPSSCHRFAGIDGRREGNTSSQRRNIFIAVVTSVNTDVECNNTDADLERTAGLPIVIDENEEFTFNFLVGETAGGEAIYETVVVPVADPSVGN